MNSYYSAHSIQSTSVRYLFFFALLCNFIFSYETAMVEYGVATIAAELNADPVEASGLLFWNFFAAAVGVAIAPYIGSGINPLRCVRIGVALAIMVAVIGCIIRTVMDFSLVRIALGLLYANVSVFLAAFIGQSTTANERTAVFGGTGIGIGLGYLCAPFAIAMSLHMAGTWRYAYGSIILGLILILLLSRTVDDQQRSGEMSGASRNGLDLLSLCSLVIFLACCAFAIHPSSPLAKGYWTIMLAGVGGIAFYGVLWTSRRCDNPAMDLQLVIHAKAWPLLLGTMLSFCATFLIAFIAPYLSLYSVSAQAEIGVLLLAAFPIGFALGGVLSSSVLAALPFGRLALLAHLGCALAALAGAWLVRLDSPAVLAIAYLASGTMRGITIAPMGTIATVQVPVYRLPSFLSTVTIFRSMGMLIGVGMGAQAWMYFGVDRVLAEAGEIDVQHAIVAQHASQLYIVATVLYALACTLLSKYRHLK